MDEEKMLRKAQHKQEEKHSRKMQNNCYKQRSLSDAGELLLGLKVLKCYL